MNIVVSTHAYTYNIDSYNTTAALPNTANRAMFNPR